VAPLAQDYGDIGRVSVMTLGRRSFRWRWPLALLAVAAAGCLLAPANAAWADVPISVTGFPTTTPSAVPDGITLGPDGALWFTEEGANQIGRITTSGAITEFPLTATPSSEPRAIIDGPDGALWFVQPGPNDVGRMTTTGSVSEFSIAVTGGCTNAGSGPAGIVAGSDGNIWVTEDRNNPGQFAEITIPAHTVTQNCMVTGAGQLGAIAAGSDGAMWFTQGFDLIGRLQTDGNVSYPPPSVASSALMPIVAGPGGDLWIGVKGAPSAVDSITIGAVLTPFSLPASSTAGVQVLGSGPDGQLWLVGGGNLTSVTTGGVFNQFNGIYPSGDTIAGITAGPGDTLWLTDATSSTIYRVTLGTTPSIAAALGPVSAVGGTSATVAGTLSVPAGDVQQGVSYDFQYGQTTAYGSTSTPAVAAASANGTPVSATLSGLAPDTTYHYRLVASGCSPASCQAMTGDQSFTTGLNLTPVLGQSVGVAGIHGKVLVRLAGHHRFVRIGSSGELIPLGSTINTRHGHVLIESATATMSQQVASGIFYGGSFVVTQPTGATTTVLALDSSFAACPRRAHRAAAGSTSKRHTSHKVVNQVFGNAHGQYTTRGHYAAAADEGTSWRVADRCDGTYVAVSVGEVDVTDLVRHRTFVLSAGRHYLASPR
jgi:virginiamycin B lyase